MASSPVPSVVSGSQTTLIARAQSPTPSASEACWQLIKVHEPLLRSLFRELHIDWVPEAEDIDATKRRQLAQRPEFSEDVRQTAWLKFLESLKRFDTERGFPLGAFVRKPVKGAIVETIRHDASYHAATVSLGDAEETPSDTHRQELQLAVQVFLDSLPPRQRSVTELIGLEGRSQADAARLLGISRAAVNKAWQKAMAKGRGALQSYAPTDSNT